MKSTKYRARTPRIHGELLKPGYEVAQSSVAKYMVKRRGPHEDTPFRGVLSRLEPAERELFEAFVHNRFGNGVRLEQERISFGRVQHALQAIAVVTPHA